MDTLEIDKLQAGPELDALVAEKVMKFKWYIRNGVCYCDYNSSNSPDCWYDFSPSTSFAHCQDVLNRLSQYYWDIKWLAVDRRWEVEPWPYKDWAEKQFFVGDKSFMVSVCKASLKLVLSENYDPFEAIRVIDNVRRELEGK